MYHFFIINFSYNSLSEIIRQKMNEKHFPKGQVKNLSAQHRLSTDFSTFSTLLVNGECLNSRFNSLLKNLLKVSQQKTCKIL